MLFAEQRMAQDDRRRPDISIALQHSIENYREHLYTFLSISTLPGQRRDCTYISAILVGCHGRKGWQ